MSTLVQNVLVIGGGFSGLAAAIELRKRGIAVEVVELEPDWLTDGIGISVIGATLRALCSLGVLDEFLSEGHVADGIELRALDGRLLAQLPTPRIAGADLPGGGAIMRRSLARILADKALGMGVEVRLGSTFRAIHHDVDSIEVEFADGQRRRFDLVIGADGIRSKVRDAVQLGGATPEYCGQRSWRALVPRARGIERTTLWVEGHVKLGVCPVSETDMYLFINENHVLPDPVPENQLLPLAKGLLTHLPNKGLQRLGEQLNSRSCVVMRPMESLLLPLPWHQGRVVLIGDAAHATTPHLASGTALGIEDAIVLAATLDTATSVPKALAEFEQRRWERCQRTVDAARRLSEIEVRGQGGSAHLELMEASFARLAEEV